MLEPEAFEPFSKTPRLNRNIIVSEKLDGMNGQIYITEENDLYIGSRSKWLCATDDCKGFANWVLAHRNEIMTLGPGRHFGEWWGQGLGRKYGLKEKRFSLFNTRRWALHGTEPKVIGPMGRTQDILPACCSLVPVLYDGPFSEVAIKSCLAQLREQGSLAAPGFDDPEGIIVFHEGANLGFKVTLKGDESPKSLIS